MKTFLTTDQAYPKIKFFCSYRERCHREVKEKLYALGLNKAKAEELMAKLIADGFLNEERFAIQFAGSYFRIKKWGKLKIVFALRQKGISEANIKKAMHEIGPADYTRTLLKAAKLKWNSLNNERVISRQAKTTAYLLQKGFEAPRVREIVMQLKEALNSKS